MNKIDVDDIMLSHRQVFLVGVVKDPLILKVSKELLYLNSISHRPIKLWINSPGGSTTSGLSLINLMRKIKSDVITIINTEACSMGSQISVAGNKRLMFKNAWWMAHDMSGGIGGDYSAKVKYRAEYIEKHYQTLEDNYKRFTKLSKKDLEIARHGELWLSSEDCLKKGIVDKII